MLSNVLEDYIVRDKADGKIPFFVNCTSGSTVTGAFDPINDLADLCQKHNLWLHVDVSIVSYSCKWVALIACKKWIPLPFNLDCRGRARQLLCVDVLGAAGERRRHKDALIEFTTDSREARN